MDGGPGAPEDVLPVGVPGALGWPRPDSPARADYLRGESSITLRSAVDRLPGGGSPFLVGGAVGPLFDRVLRLAHAPGGGDPAEARAERCVGGSDRHRPAETGRMCADLSRGRPHPRRGAGSLSSGRARACPEVEGRRRPRCSRRDLRRLWDRAAVPAAQGTDRGQIRPAHRRRRAAQRSARGRTGASAACDRDDATRSPQPDARGDRRSLSH